ncbi:MAG TPA: hypothetical protein VN613_08195 [Gemmatimonadaceae bacterium]|nr:hypothetical protein [Gemmatimonadaceae bacterium]
MVISRWRGVLRLVAAVPLAAAAAGAQDRVLRVVSDDSTPIPYAFVQANGGRALLTDESGLVRFGPGKKQTLTLDVRRIGYKPFYGKLDFPDTGITLQVVLPRLAEQLRSVKVTSRKTASPLELSGFYKRWLDMQKGATSAVFIGPEEIEKRNTSRTSMLLSGVSGISISRTSNGNSVVTSGNTCPMAVIVDGRQVCPNGGCLSDDPGKSGLNDQNSVLIDQIVSVDALAGIEVYKRGGNMPSDFHVDGECGAIALWTGSRKP